MFNLFDLMSYMQKRLRLVSILMSVENFILYSSHNRTQTASQFMFPNSNDQEPSFCQPGVYHFVSFSVIGNFLIPICLP